MCLQTIRSEGKAGKFRKSQDLVGPTSLLKKKKRKKEWMSTCFPTPQQADITLMHGIPMANKQILSICV